MLLDFDFLNVDFLASYEGDGGEGTTGDGGEGGEGGTGTGGEGTTGDGGDGGATGDVSMTQEKLNSLLADAKRKGQSQGKKDYEDRNKELEASYEERLAQQGVSQEETDKLRKTLEDLQARHRTKEQQLEHDRKVTEDQYVLDLEEAKSSAESWETRYTESTINRELLNAGIKHEAFNANQIVTELRGKTTLVEQTDQKGKPTGVIVPMVEMTVKNEDTGVQEKLQMTPDEAVEYMKKSPALWGNFFKNNIREGIGSSSATGGAMTGDGTVDHASLTDEQWYKLRRENPEALGLKPSR